MTSLCAHCARQLLSSLTTCQCGWGVSINTPFSRVSLAEKEGYGSKTHPTQDNTGGDDAVTPIGAAWMREQVDNAITYLECDKVPEFSCMVGPEYAYQQGFNDALEIGRNAIRAIPLPTSADLLAEAMKLPEVAALVEAARSVNRDNIHGNGLEGFRKHKDRLRITLNNLDAALTPFTAAKATT